jgi:hypothetical protein
MHNPNLGTIIANGTMMAFALHTRGRKVEVTDALVADLRTEAKAAVDSILAMGLDLASLGESTVRYAINVECYAAAGRVIARLTKPKEPPP